MTRETEKAFKILYCEYKRRRKAGTPIYSAVSFEDGIIPRLKAFKDWIPADIEYALSELRKSGYIKEDIVGDVTLLEAGLEYMEPKPRDFFDDLKRLFDLVGLFV